MLLLLLLIWSNFLVSVSSVTVRLSRECAVLKVVDLFFWGLLLPGCRLKLENRIGFGGDPAS